MRRRRIRRVTLKTVRRVKVVGRFRSYAQPIKTPMGVGNHGAQQCPANAVAPVGAQDVKPPNSTGAWVTGIWVTVQPTDANHPTVTDSEKQGLTRIVEPICSGSPFVT